MKKGIPLLSLPFFFFTVCILLHIPLRGAAQDNSFTVFKEQLAESVSKNDTTFVFSHTSDTVQNGFAFETGLERFKELWHDRYTMLRNELAEALALGASAADDGAQTLRYVAPSYFLSFPDSLNPFQYAYVLTDSLPALNERGSRISRSGLHKDSLVQVLEWDIIPAPEADTSSSWTRIVTTQADTMVVLTRHLRSPVDYRFWFERVQGRWMLMGWAAGD